MPGMNGFTGLLLIRAEFPATAVIVVSASEDPVTQPLPRFRRLQIYPEFGAERASRRGAARSVRRRSVVSRTCRAPVRAEDIALGARLASLTPRQLKVFTMIAEGRLNKQIAYEMQVTEAAVKAHVTMIPRKLGVDNRTQAVIAAGRLLVDPPPPLSGPVAAPAEPSGQQRPQRGELWSSSCGRYRRKVKLSQGGE
jgi:DNA-binding CsgD family transcriptional regulator